MPSVCMVLLSHCGHLLVRGPPSLLPSSYMQASTEEGENKHITVMETSTGSKLTGEDAPLEHELEEWLKEHPG